MIRVSESTLDAFRLSPREREVVELLLDGMQFKQMARKLFVSHETVRTHMAHIREKTKAQDKAGIVCALWRAEQEAA